jgi:hypothetical protein
MSDFVIESGVPLPPPSCRTAANRKHRKLPFTRMSVGDSFFVSTGDPVSEARNMLTAGKHKGFGVTCRRVEGGIRVWRTA